MADRDQQLADEGFVSIQGAADFLSVSRGMIHVLLNRGELPSAKIGRVRRIPRKALLQFASQQLASASK